MNLTYILFVLTVALLVSTGCMSEREQMLSKGYPIEYIDGFEDGKTSGMKAGGSWFDQFKKNVKRFETSKEYAQGWKDGYTQGRAEEAAIQRNTELSIEQQTLYEQKRHDRKVEDQHLLDGINTKGLDKLK